MAAKYDPIMLQTSFQISTKHHADIIQMIFRQQNTEDSTKMTARHRANIVQTSFKYHSNIIQTSSKYHLDNQKMKTISKGQQDNVQTLFRHH
jgi:hypothetical protein